MQQIQMVNDRFNISDNKVKILFISGILGGGGAERQTSYLLKFLNKDKFETVLCLYRIEGSYLRDIPQDLRIYDLGAKGRFNIPKVLWRLIRIIHRENPDIIFSNLWGSNRIAILAHKLSHANHKRKLLLGIQNNPLSYNKVAQRLMPLMYPMVDLLIACSKGVANEAIRKLGISRDKIQVVYNAVDIARISALAKEPVEHQWLGKFPTIISVGSLTPQKGHVYLLKALKIINQTTPIYLLLLGDGPEKRKLQKLAISLGIHDRVDFLGYQPNPFKYMASADVFVLSSLWEGLPNVLVEALACNIPIVATNAPYGSQEVIQNGKNGFLLPTANPEALVYKIIRILNNSTLREKFTVEGLKIVHEKFSIEKIIKQYENIFMHVCNL